MKLPRRKFLHLAAGAAALAAPSRIARAQNYPSRPVRARMLQDYGYVEGQNVRLVSRFAEGHDERYLAMALPSMRVARADEVIE